MRIKYNPLLYSNTNIEPKIIIIKPSESGNKFLDFFKFFWTEVNKSKEIETKLLQEKEEALYLFDWKEV